MATDEGMAKLGRRDIVVAWRGTHQALEWVNDLQILLVSPSKILGEQDGDTKVHQGFYSINTSNDPRSPFTKTSARDQVILINYLHISLYFLSKEKHTQPKKVDQKMNHIKSQTLCDVSTLRRHLVYNASFFR